MPSPRCLHIIGRKNSGKTTLVVDLVQELTRRGLRVGTIKHTHHHHELDTPGKDSYQHREAGAAIVGILAPQMTAIFTPPVKNETPEARFSALVTSMHHCDLVLVEGGQQLEGLKIEVWRSAVTEAPLAAHDTSLAALVTDDDLPVDVDLPCWSRSDVAELATRVLNFVEASSP